MYLAVYLKYEFISNPESNPDICQDEKEIKGNMEIR
jgi:hypothetical protein